MAVGTWWAGDRKVCRVLGFGVQRARTRLGTCRVSYVQGVGKYEVSLPCSLFSPFLPPSLPSSLLPSFPPPPSLFLSLSLSLSLSTFFLCHWRADQMHHSHSHT